MMSITGPDRQGGRLEQGGHSLPAGEPAAVSDGDGEAAAVKAFLDALAAANGGLAALDPSDFDDIADAMALLYTTLAASDRTLLRAFDIFDEAWLASAALERAHAIVADGAIAVELHPGDPVATLRDAAVLLRALEQIVGPSSRIVEGDHEGDLEDGCATRDLSAFVLPRIGPLAAKTGQSFQRRALIHYRIVPTRLDRFAVRLHRSPALDGEPAGEGDGTGAERAYGAGFFPGLKAQLVQSDDAFHIEGLEGFDPADFIARQVAAARAEQCIAITWPELTMPDRHIALVQEALSATALNDEGLSPHFVVAGSWHREDGAGVRRNIGVVLDGGGAPLFEIIKWAQFRWEAKLEAIRPGDEIPLLLCEDGLIAFAICRDFLDDIAEPPYCLLDVDLAVVPSMASLAEPATMSGHRATARTMALRFGTRTMVVLQPPLPGDGADVGQTLRVSNGDDIDGVLETIAGFWASCRWKAS